MTAHIINEKSKLLQNKLTFLIKVEKLKLSKKQMKTFKRILLNIMLLASLTFSYAQNSDNFVSINGMLSLSYDGYSSAVQNYQNYRSAYPAELYRFNANATLYFGKYFSIPFGINFSNQERTYNLPTLPEEGVYNYVRNPRNNFHFDPTYKWIHATIGSQTPQYSEFTSGDMQIFGAGIEINPKKFIFSASYGTSQYAVEPDAALHIAGGFEQKIMSARLGYGKIEGSKFTLNIVKLEDDVNSLTQMPAGVHPHEGISFAPMLELNITEKLKLTSEIAASVFTENLLANNNLIEELPIDKISKWITLNNSSVIDYAHKNGISWQDKNFGIGVEVKYVGPGFMSVGYRNIEKDIIDYKLNSNFKLFKNKLIFNGLIGLRSNNITNTKLDKNNRIIGNVNLQAQLSKKFSINANYSNFGFRNNRRDNLYRIEMVSNAMSITPTYQVVNKKRFQQISLTASLDKFSQFDTYSQSTINTENRLLQANYVTGFTKTGFSFGLFAMYLQNHSDLFSFDMMNGGLNIGYQFFKKKLKTNLYTTYTHLLQKNYSGDDRLNVNVKIKYQLAKKTDLRFGYYFNDRRYGSYRPGAVVQENRFQISLNQKF